VLTWEIQFCIEAVVPGLSNLCCVAAHTIYGHNPEQSYIVIHLHLIFFVIIIIIVPFLERYSLQQTVQLSCTVRVRIAILKGIRLHVPFFVSSAFSGKAPQTCFASL
jgi:hypothetical protein